MAAHLLVLPGFGYDRLRQVQVDTARVWEEFLRLDSIYDKELSPAALETTEPYSLDRKYVKELAARFLTTRTIRVCMNATVSDIMVKFSSWKAKGNILHVKLGDEELKFPVTGLGVEGVRYEGVAIVPWSECLVEIVIGKLVRIKEGSGKIPRVSSHEPMTREALFPEHRTTVLELDVPPNFDSAFTRLRVAYGDFLKGRKVNVGKEQERNFQNAKRLGERRFEMRLVNGRVLTNRGRSSLHAEVELGNGLTQGFTFPVISGMPERDIKDIDGVRITTRKGERSFVAQLEHGV